MSGPFAAPIISCRKNYVFSSNLAGEVLDFFILTKLKSVIDNSQSLNVALNLPIPFHSPTTV